MAAAPLMQHHCAADQPARRPAARGCGGPHRGVGAAPPGAVPQAGADELEVTRPVDGVDAAAHVQRRVDGLEVAPGGVHADAHPAGDGLVAQALAHQSQRLELTIGESDVRAVRARGSVARRERGRQQHRARPGGPEQVDQLQERPSLGDEGRRTGPLRERDPLGVDVRGDHGDGGAGAGLPDLARRGQTAHPRHLQVHHHHRRSQGRHHRQSSLRARRRPDAADAVEELQGRRQQVGERAVVVHHQDRRLTVCWVVRLERQDRLVCRHVHPPVCDWPEELVPVSVDGVRRRPRHPSGQRRG